MPRRRRQKSANASQPRRTVAHRIDVRVTEHESGRIGELVAARRFLSRADFVRQALRDKLAALPVEGKPKEPSRQANAQR